MNVAPILLNLIKKIILTGIKHVKRRKKADVLFVVNFFILINIH